MRSHNLFRNRGYSGGFLPILDDPTKGFQNCLGTIYYRNPAIRDTLNALQRRQRHNLKYSLVSAYVRRTDAAFAGDPALQTLLDDMRDLLLKSEARKAINMLDVPEDERHRGKDWRAQLLASGVPKRRQAHPQGPGGPRDRPRGDGRGGRGGRASGAVDPGAGRGSRDRGLRRTIRRRVGHEQGLQAEVWPPVTAEEAAG